MLKFIYFKSYLNIDYKLFSIKTNLFKYNTSKEFNPLFTLYLASLIEGDSTIIILKTERLPKGNIYYLLI